MILSRELQTAAQLRYAKAFKADIVARYQMAGASVARIAHSHNLNANMVPTSLCIYRRNVEASRA